MNTAEIQAASDALRATHFPRAWFDNPQLDPADWYVWDHQAPYGTSHTPPYLGRRNLTQSTDKRRGNAFYYDSNATANFIFEAVRDLLIAPVWNNQPGGFSNGLALPWFWAMRLNRSNGASGPGEKYQGISWGPITNTNTPWQTQHAIMESTISRIGLHWNFTIERWQLQVFGYDYELEQTQPPTLYTLPESTDALLTDTQICEASLLWVPGLPNPDAPDSCTVPDSWR